MKLRSIKLRQNSLPENVVWKCRKQDIWLCICFTCEILVKYRSLNFPWGDYAKVCSLIAHVKLLTV